MAAAVLAAALMTVLCAGCGHPAALLPALDGPPAHPHCGGPVLTLSAPQLQRAYGLPAMLAAGINGAGTTIADILPYANPWVARDLAVYSRRYGLPPARLQILSYGHAPPATRSGQAAHWAKEGIEDVEMMHTFAPGAALIYLQVPDVDSELMYDQALSWLVARLRPGRGQLFLRHPGVHRRRAGPSRAAGRRPRRGHGRGRHRGHRGHRAGRRDLVPVPGRAMASL